MHVTAPVSLISLPISVFGDARRPQPHGGREAKSNRRGYHIPGTRWSFFCYTGSTTLAIGLTGVERNW
jgi:hypothetical protein